MNSLVFLIPLSVLLIIGAGALLFWAVDHGQFDDLETPGLLPLVDADEPLLGSGENDRRSADAEQDAEREP